MDIQETIKSCVGRVIEEGKGHFAIYPFGVNGIITKGILNYYYGVNEDVVVDNYFTGASFPGKKLEEIDDCSKYTWLVNCSAPEVRKDILDSLRDVPKDQIVDMFAESDTVERHPLHLLLKEDGSNTINDVVCEEFVNLVKDKKASAGKVTVAEIGIDLGATTLAVSKVLDKADTYYLFDFEEVVSALTSDLRELPEIKCDYVQVGNTHKTYDSYVWNLSNLVFQMRNDKIDGIFDVVYLDGAHNLIHDGLACCMLKEMIRPGGYVVFDDVNWSYEISHTCNPKVNSVVKNGFTHEQICDCQVKRVIRLFMERDEHFEKIKMCCENGREVWKRIV